MRYATQDWRRVKDNPRLNIGLAREQIGTFTLAYRVYQTPGKTWPRLVVCVTHGLLDPTTVRMSCAIKHGSGRWWEQCEVPTSLAFDVSELWQEAASLKATEKESD